MSKQFLKTIVIIFIMIIFVTCSNNTNDYNKNKILHETIQYARKWHLPDSIFLNDNFYMADYEFYKNYCNWLKNSDEICLENKKGLRVIFMPNRLGWSEYSEIYSLYKNNNQVHFIKKVMDLKDSSPIYHVDSMKMDTICVNNNIATSVWDSIIVIMKNYEYVNIPPLDIVLGSKTIGHGDSFFVEFNDGFNYHRIYRVFFSSKEVTEMILCYKLKVILNKLCEKKFIEIMDK